MKVINYDLSVILLVVPLLRLRHSGYNNSFLTLLLEYSFFQLGVSSIPKSSACKKIVIALFLLPFKKVDKCT